MVCHIERKWRPGGDWDEYWRLYAALLLYFSTLDLFAVAGSLSDKIGILCSRFRLGLLCDADCMASVSWEAPWDDGLRCGPLLAHSGAEFRSMGAVRCNVHQRAGGVPVLLSHRSPEPCGVGVCHLVCIKATGDLFCTALAAAVLEEKS